MGEGEGRSDISPDDRLGRILVGLARQAVIRYLSGEPDVDTGLVNPETRHPLLKEKRAVFVTLKTAGGELRGCIGSLEARTELAQDVITNAQHAAFHDHRFPPVTAKELEGIVFEVSLLSPARRLDYDGPADLLEKLRPGIDGVILEKGSCKATFLPQVWRQLPETEAFLSQLCEKAGLDAAAWKAEHPVIHVYQVHSFSEGSIS